MFSYIEPHKEWDGHQFKSAGFLLVLKLVAVWVSAYLVAESRRYGWAFPPVLALVFAAIGYWQDRQFLLALAEVHPVDKPRILVRHPSDCRIPSIFHRP